AEVLFSDIRLRALLDPGVSAPRAIERHHLFPRGYLERLGIKDLRLVNAIANMAFLDWPENATIGDEAPLGYWSTMVKRIDPKRLKDQIYWHALPVGWEQLDYPTFLERRRPLIAMVVRNGFETLWDSTTQTPHPESLDDIIAAGESQTVEF